MFYSCLRFQKTAPLVVLLMVLLTSVSAAMAAGSTILWQSRDQFVALAPLEGEQGQKTLPNGHPAVISRERLDAMLSSLEIRTMPGEPVSQLFTRESLDVLVPQLQSALQQAGPKDDVTFAVIGLYRAFMGLGKTSRVTAGRLFVEHGRINIIFGQVQQDFKEREDRRLAPFTPGERSAPLPGEWRLVPPAGPEVELVRRDWVAFGEGWQAPVEPAPAAALAVPHASAVPRNAPPNPGKAGETGRPLAERLIILNDLKDKGLISDEEYKAKRLNILNEI